MIFFKKYFVNSKEKLEFLPIGHDIRYALRDAGVKQGLMTVQVLQPELALQRLAADEAAQQALKAQPALLLSRQLSLIVEEAELQMGKHEDIYLVELSSKPSRREFLVQVLSSEEKEKEKTKAAPARR